MPNMSYCRFQNTLQDLRDCANHISDTDLSQDEASARERLISICREVVEEYDGQQEEENGIGMPE